MSRNAKHKSSSWIIVAGISLLTILSKKVGALGLMAGSLEADAAAAATSSVELILR
eukprot:CAMPEP_0181341300 /NCGR_PEP_ID=MMETSP1101-20121128/30331_1 /TAXON_ID=46948 /ORGANISM="Rhodomonas abbreviata, Strain Caron Lab Isolate" /LENGTH=55 /DNA_ID=CAMNT_0023452557 /DNA_START=272 /DNA_END=439 /DNA_ORIENTATION=+